MTGEVAMINVIYVVGELLLSIAGFAAVLTVLFAVFLGSVYLTASVLLNILWACQALARRERPMWCWPRSAQGVVVYDTPVMHARSETQG
jgi:hypothetical protein